MHDIIHLRNFDKHEFIVKFENEFCVTGNSRLYMCEIDKKTISKYNFSGKTVAKVTHEQNLTVSYNMEWISIEKIINNKSPNNQSYIIPSMVLWGRIGDGTREVLVTEYYESLLNIDNALNKYQCKSNDIIIKLADSIAMLHSLGISGYDTEFFWSESEEKIAIVDVGPSYTFGYTAQQMIEKHLFLEEDNIRGIENILFSCVSREYIDENGTMFFTKPKELIKVIELDSLLRHVYDVGITHALDLLGRINHERALVLLKSFIEEYENEVVILNDYHKMYCKAFKDAITNDQKRARSRLYYPKYDVIRSSMCVVDTCKSGYVL